MKKLIILLLSAMSLTAFAQQKKVAVYLIGEQTTVSKVLGDELVKAFAKSGKYAAIERTKYFLAELENEQSYQRSGAVDDKVIARLGVQFGVNYVCVAEMSDFFEEKYISLRLIDVETAEVVNLHNVHGLLNSPDACVQMANDIASNLSKGSFAEQEKERQLREEAARIQAEKKRLAEIEEKKRKEAQKYQSLKSQGYVDLGLPSGTWWRVEPESEKCIKFEEVENRNALPSPYQMRELVKYCRWERSGHGFIAIGPNGNSIVFPATFSYKEWGKYHYRGDYFTSEQYIGLEFSDYSTKPQVEKNTYNFPSFERWVVVP